MTITSDWIYKPDWWKDYYCNTSNIKTTLTSDKVAENASITTSTYMNQIGDLQAQIDILKENI